MDSFIFAGVSLLILLPIVYFLPLGFTVKGKVFIVVASLLIGLFGLVSESVFPVWQTALILLVFVGALAYIMSKRNLDWLYLQEENEDPFSIEEERDILPTKEIKDSYNYIATSEKAPKQLLVEETNGTGVTINTTSTKLLDKLISQNQKNLSLINNVQNLDEELEINELKSKPVREEEQKVNQSELVIKEMEPISATKNHDTAIINSEIETLVHKEEEDLKDPDIEALVHKTEELAQEMESTTAQTEDSSSYLSELEIMIESEGQVSNNGSLIENEHNHNDDSLEIITDFKTKPSVVIEEPKFWLDDEFELEELTLDDATSRKKTVVEVKQEENEQENIFDLEELVFGEPDSLQNRDTEKKKILEQAVEDNKMVKQ